MKLVLVSTGVELDDAKLLSDLKVQNDDVVGLCYKKEAVEGMPVVSEQSPQSGLFAQSSACHWNH